MKVAHSERAHEGHIGRQVQEVRCVGLHGWCYERQVRRRLIENSSVRVNLLCALIRPRQIRTTQFNARPV
jgi:hypothetical protein